MSNVTVAMEGETSSHSSDNNSNQVSLEKKGLKDLVLSLKTTESFIYRYRLITLFNLLVDLVRCREKWEIPGRLYSILCMYRPESAVETVERLRPYYEDIKFACITGYNYITGKESLSLTEALTQVDKIPDDLETVPHGAKEIFNEMKNKLKPDKPDELLEEHTPFLKFLFSVITIFGALFGVKAVFNFANLRDKTKDFVNSVNTLKAAKTLYQELDTFSDSLLSMVYDLMGKEYISPKLKHVKELSDKISALHEECNVYLRACKTDFFGLMRNFRGHIFLAKYNKCLAAMTKLTEQEKSNYNFTLRLSKIFEIIDEMQNRYMEMVASSCGKQNPTVLWISGLPGVGKTRLVNKLCAEMAKEYGMPYARTWSEEYWSNYQLQAICTMDDMLQHSEGKDLMEFHMYTSEDAKNIVGARLEEKGKPFVSRFMFVTSNYNWIAPPVKLTDLEALNRRRHFVIYMHNPAVAEYKAKNQGTDNTDLDWWKNHPPRYFLIDPIYGCTLKDLVAVRNLKFDPYAPWVIGEMTEAQILTAVKEREKYFAELYRQRLLHFVGTDHEFPIPQEPIEYDRTLFDVNAARASITDGSLVSRMITFHHHYDLKPGMLGPPPSPSSSEISTSDDEDEDSDEEKESIDSEFYEHCALQEGFNTWQEYEQHLIQTKEQAYEQSLQRYYGDWNVLDTVEHAFGIKKRTRRLKYGLLLKGDAGVGKTYLMNQHLSPEKCYFVKYQKDEKYPSDKVLVFDDFVHNVERKAQYICALIDFENNVIKNPCIFATCNTNVDNWKNMSSVEKDLIKRRNFVCGIKYKNTFKIACQMKGKKTYRVIRNMDQHERSKHLVTKMSIPKDTAFEQLSTLENTWDGVSNLISWYVNCMQDNEEAVEELEPLELPQPAWPDIIIRCDKGLSEFEPHIFLSMETFNLFHIQKLGSDKKYHKMSMTEAIKIAAPIFKAFGKTSRSIANDPKHYTVIFNAKKIKCPNFPHMYVHFNDCQFGFVQAPCDETVVAYYVTPGKYESDMRITKDAILVGNETYTFDTEQQKRFLSAIRNFAKGDLIKVVEKPDHEKIAYQEFLKSDMSELVQLGITLASLALAGGSVVSLLTPFWKSFGKKEKEEESEDEDTEEKHIVIVKHEGKRGKNKRKAAAKNPISDTGDSPGEQSHEPPARINLHSDMIDLYRKNYYEITAMSAEEHQDLLVHEKIKKKIKSKKGDPIRDGEDLSRGEANTEPPTRLVLRGNLKYNAADFRPNVSDDKDRFCLVYSNLYDAFGVKYQSKIYYLHPDVEGLYFGRTVVDNFIWSKVEHPSGKEIGRADHLAINSIVNQNVVIPKKSECNADSVWAFLMVYGEAYDYWNEKVDERFIEHIFNQDVLWPKHVAKPGVIPEGNRAQYHMAVDPTLFEFVGRIKPNMCEILHPKSEEVMLRGVMLKGKYGITNNHCPMPALLRMAYREDKLYKIDKILEDRMHDVCIFEVKDVSFPAVKDITNTIPTREELGNRISHDYGAQVRIYLMKYVYNEKFKARDFNHTMAPAEFNVRLEPKTQVKNTTGTVTFSYDLDSLGLSGCSTYGDCGSVVCYVDKTLQAKWCAILSAGSRDLTVARYFTRDYILDLFGRIHKSENKEDLDVKNHSAQDWDVPTYVPNSYLRFFEEARIDRELGLEWVGKSSLKVFHPTSTMLYKTGMFLESGFEPTVKSLWDPRNLERRSMFKEGLKRYTGALEVDPDSQKMFIEAAVEVGKELARLMKMQGLNNRVLTMTEAINRLHNWESPFSRAIDRSGSVGFPWVQLNSQRSRKQDYLEMRGENWYFKPREKDPVAHDIMNKTHQQFEDAYKNRLHLNVAIPYLKDETVPVMKIYNPEKMKTRIFYSLPMPFLINYRRLFASPMWRITETMAHHPIKVGINCTSHQWQQLYYSHTKVSTMGFASDMSNWDGTLPLELIKCVPIVWNTIFKITDPNWKPEDDIARINLHKSLEGAYIVAGDNIYRLNQALSVYGDDNFCTVHPDCQDWFHFNSFKEEAARFGIVVTSTSKDGKAMPNLQHIEELEFLKRRFRPDSGYIMAPLAKTSIIKSLAWVRDRGAYEPVKDPPHFLFARNTREIELNVLKACVEMSLHGEQEFEKFILELEEELIRIKLMVILPNWRDALAIVDFYV
uniref:RNA-dependent RNA polymerase n=1 Tax=Picornavirales sp. TaxID=1955153 RepID=A0A514DBI0_9VIRU|nr:MAG: RNA-dependent RNA polymerase [Picornavirales sp.]